jgi:hypothetical protein
LTEFSGEWKGRPTSRWSRPLKKRGGSAAIRYAVPSYDERSMKTDASIKGIVVAAIRRHSLEMNTWRGTRLWEDGDPVHKDEIQHECALLEGELPILYSYLMFDSFSAVHRPILR